jgi:hypothetical protein
LAQYLATKDVTAVSIVVDALKIFGDGIDEDAHEHSMSLLSTPIGETEAKQLPKSADAFMHADEIMQKVFFLPLFLFIVSILFFI